MSIRNIRVSGDPQPVEPPQPPNKFRSALAEALLRGGTQTGPILSTGEGIARLGQAALGGFLNNQLSKEQDQFNKHKVDGLRNFAKPIFNPSGASDQSLVDAMLKSQEPKPNLPSLAFNDPSPENVAIAGGQFNEDVTAIGSNGKPFTSFEQRLGNLEKIDPTPPREANFVSNVNPEQDQLVQALANRNSQGLNQFNALLESGNHNAALQFALAEQERMRKGQKSPFGNVDPSKFTPESLAAFQQSRNFGDLRSIQSGIDPNTRFQVEAQDRRAKEQRQFTRRQNELKRIDDQLQRNFAKAENKKEALFKNETTLRKEFETLSKDFVKQRDSFFRVQASAHDPSPAGDLALIFNYMKVLDPGSVVRESEFATAASTGSFGERIKAAVGRVVQGERLSDVQREDFVARAGKLFQAGMQSHSQLEAQFNGMALRNGLNPDNILVDFNQEIPQRRSTDRGQGGPEVPLPTQPTPAIPADTPNLPTAPQTRGPALTPPSSGEGIQTPRRLSPSEEQRFFRDGIEKFGFDHVIEIDGEFFGVTPDGQKHPLAKRPKNR